MRGSKMEEMVVRINHQSTTSHPAPGEGRAFSRRMGIWSPLSPIRESDRCLGLGAHFVLVPNGSVEIVGAITWIAPACLADGHPNRRVKGWGVRKSTVITGPINVWHLSQVVGTSRATSLGGADGKGGEMGQMANGRRRREDIPRPDSHIHRVWGEHAGPPPPGHAAQWGLTGSGFLRGPVHRRRIGVRPGSPSADRKAGHHFGFPRQP